MIDFFSISKAAKHNDTKINRSRITAGISNCSQCSVADGIGI